MPQVDVRASVSVFFLALFSVLFIVIGFQGSLGRMLAVLLCPDRLEEWQSGINSSSGSFGEEKTA